MARVSPSSGGGAEVWAPSLQSAVGTSGRSIRLSWYYSLSPSNKFKFERTNLTYLTTKEFEVIVPAITHNYTFDVTTAASASILQTSTGTAWPPITPVSRLHAVVRSGNRRNVRHAVRTGF
jgi:hypothetical protein